MSLILILGLFHFPTSMRDVNSILHQGSSPANSLQPSVVYNSVPYACKTLVELINFLFLRYMIILKAFC